MKKVITYGTYDLLHYGHMNLLKRVKALGDYLIVGITSDQYDKSRGKLNVNQSLMERIEAVKKTGLADQIIVEEYDGQKLDDIKKYKVDIFAIGSDWIGKFDYLNEYCTVIYLPRTEGISSSELRNQTHKTIKIAIVGISHTASKFYHEAKTVGGIRVVGCYDEDPTRSNEFAKNHNIDIYADFEELLKQVHAIYVCCNLTSRFKIIKRAIEKGRHVLCHTPMFLNRWQADICHKMAKDKKIVLFEGIKTLYFPAFTHLLLLINTGIVGEVKDISLSCSIERKFEVVENKYGGSLYSWTNVALLPIIKILGTDIQKQYIFDYSESGDTYSKLTSGIIQYRNATANFKAGKNIKTEGSMVITGTNGYIYVPAPWWKMDYFEVRYEDLRSTRKYFYKYEGEGYRYMIWEFIHIINGEKESSRLSEEEQVCMADILDAYNEGEYFKIQ